MTLHQSQVKKVFSDNDIEINMDHKCCNCTVFFQRPIHWACVNGHIAIVDLLLQRGVNIDSVDNKGCSPLIVACQYGKTMLAGYLMGKGATIQTIDGDGDTALHWAAFKGKLDKFFGLQKKHIFVNSQFGY